MRVRPNGPCQGVCGASSRDPWRARASWKSSDTYPAIVLGVAEEAKCAERFVTSQTTFGMTNEWLRLAEEDFAVADGEGDFGEGGDVLDGEGGAQRKKLAT